MKINNLYEFENACAKHGMLDKFYEFIQFTKNEEKNYEKLIEIWLKTTKCKSEKEIMDKILNSSKDLRSSYILFLILYKEVIKQ